MSTTGNAPLIIANEGTMPNDEAQEKHPSLLSRLAAFIHNLDGEFPLSGGETQEDLTNSKLYLRHEAEHIKHEVAELVKNADHNFPLSGGN